MKDTPPATLRRLVGTRLTSIGRAADLECFEFQSPSAHTGIIALHVACPWRVTSSGRIVVGANDYWRPAVTGSPYDDAFEKGVIGSRLVDVGNAVVRQVIAHDRLAVLTATADHLGGFRIELSEGYAIEGFPDSAHADHDESEFWRLFEPEGPHLVISSDGLDYVT